MGVIAGLVRYPGDVFDQVKANGEFMAPAGATELANCFLDRSWDELHPTLKTFGAPLSLALNGDYEHEGGLDAFGWYESYEGGPYLGFVSPGLVNQIASRLAELSVTEFAARLTEPSRGTEYVARYYEEMVGFYRAAAENGDCVFIFVLHFPAES